MSAGTLELGTTAAQNPVLNLGGADITGGKLLFDYTGGSNNSVLSTVQAAVNSGKLYDNFPSVPGAPPLVCLDNLSNSVTVEPTVPGDASLDGTTNGADLTTVLSNYNKTGYSGLSGWQAGDFNGDGTVNGADLTTVLSNYNQHVSIGAAVPEPSTLLLAAAGLVGLLAYAWRKK